MEAFNFTVANEDCNLYTYDMRKLKAAACMHKVGLRKFSPDTTSLQAISPEAAGPHSGTLLTTVHLQCIVLSCVHK